MDGLFTNTQADRSPRKSVEWYTPAWIFEELGIDFDLDPSSPHDAETAVPAEVKYTVFDDGLSKPWFGRVWLNPPYGRDTPQWIRRMVDHGCGIALVFSRTDAAWFQEAMTACAAILFMKGRVQFTPGRENQHKRSRCGAGTAMLAFGQGCADALQKMSSRGTYIDRRTNGIAP
ncbi:DNA N-6-adenine-methyltransferase [Microbulbifer sp. SAOS-129_SWC]|uniref:DNA N-6-adenine-methyltransferase n=1 Tax=Microbulbifer sp. SAOS-129_SWC TaxID=3145235 RepID=UPI00321732FB